jgi:hypothetical protein
MTDEVTTFFNRQNELISSLLTHGELSLAQDATQMLQKNLPLAAASFFEKHICEVILDYTKEKSNNCVELVAFVEKKAINRQYHTMFDWEKNNVNKFLSLFGDEFKGRVEREINNDNIIKNAAKNFLEIGYLRNCIIHQNYATYSADKSAREIFELFESAKFFVEYIRKTLLSTPPYTPPSPNTF